MLYIGIFAGLLFLRLTVGRPSQVGTVLYYAALLALFLFAAFRFEVGCDWQGYYYQYQPDSVAVQMQDVSLISDPLWWSMIDLMIRAGFDYRWLNVLAAAFFFGGVHVLARRQPDPLAFLILLFPVLIINMPMSGIRQGAAVGVMCIAFAAFIDRRLILYLALTLVATLIHSSAMIFLLLTPIVRGAFTIERALLTGLFALPGLYVLMNTGSAELALSRYFETGVDSSGAPFRLALLALTGAFYMMLLRRKWFSEFRPDYKLATIGAGAMLALVLLLPVSTVIGDRMGYYLVPIQAMMFARIPFLKLGRNGVFYSVAAYAGLAVFFLSWAAFSDHFQLCYVPYKSWL